MNKFTALFAAASLTLAAAGAPASADVTSINEAFLLGWASDVSRLDVINWKVGDTMQYNVGMGGFGNVGSSTKAVTKDEGTALWMRQAMKLMGRNEVIEALINKADGKILKLLRNGQEQQIPDDKMEIIESDYTEVTVPAGTFKVLHIVAKTKQIQKLEIWANPQETVMDGAVKQIMSTQFGNISMELTSFKRAD
jgi:hypothetical protein